MRVRCGTSGFSYAAWKGSFYPADARGDAMLRLYAARLPAVEINATAYRMPTARVVEAWRAQVQGVAGGFRFALKGPQRITHRKRLREVAEDSAFFHAAAAGLGPCRGPELWQLPPNLKKDLPRLQDFLALLPEGSRPAFEFRHPSWQDDAVHVALSARGAALVAADWGEGGAESPLVPTTRFGYLRLRAPEYGAAALARWAERILSQPWDEAYVFFKHEDAGAGPVLAQALREALGSEAA